MKIFSKFLVIFLSLNLILTSIYPVLFNTLIYAQEEEGDEEGGDEEGGGDQGNDTGQDYSWDAYYDSTSTGDTNTPDLTQSSFEDEQYQREMEEYAGVLEEREREYQEEQAAEQARIEEANQAERARAEAEIITENNQDDVIGDYYDEQDQLQREAERQVAEEREKAAREGQNNWDWSNNVADTSNNLSDDIDDVMTRTGQSLVDFYGWAQDTVTALFDQDEQNAATEPNSTESEPTPEPTPVLTLISTKLPEGASVDLTNYFLSASGKAAKISSGETFWIKSGRNGEYIQCTNDACTNFQKIFPTENGFGIQGENHWNDVPNTTFQYRQGIFNPADPNVNLDQYPQATWLPANMKVGEVYNSGPITVVGFVISPDPDEGIIRRCDSACDNTGAGNSEISTKLTYVGPVSFGNNVKLNDVAIVEVVSGPGTGEKFYFAKDIGWVGWEYNGKSNVINSPIGGSSQAASTTRLQLPDTTKVNEFTYYDKNGDGKLNSGEKVVPWAGVVTTLKKANKRNDIPLNAGWNLVSLPALPDKPMTASTLLDDISSQGGYATTVSALQDGFWKSYVMRDGKAYSGEDFGIEPGKAYFVKAEKSSVYSFAGQDFLSPFKLNFSSGWNAVGMPLISKERTAQDLNAETVARWEWGLWDTFVKKDVQQYGENFAIEKNRGYLIKLDKEGEFSP